MKRIYIIMSLLSCSLASIAQVEPNIKPEKVTDGKSYVLVNQTQSASQYMSRTWWDGALYFLGKDDSNYANYAFKAISNADGTWSFTIDGTIDVETGEYDESNNPIMETVDATFYMQLPSGSPNVNFIPNSVSTWYLDEKENNFYNLVLKDGHNNMAMSMAQFTPTGDLRMHLNKNGDYFVIMYYGGPYYPDCKGGITETEDESTGNVYFAANDSTSFNWGFVSVENMTAYLEDFSAVKTLNDYYNEYLTGGYEDFVNGFNASFNAAMAIYKSSEYNWEDDPAKISEILNKKVNFYNAIEEALYLEDPTPALTQAIENAKSSFETISSASEVDAAIETLNNAVLAYKEGTGDLTGMGKNMSFEDLSSQGGSETDNVVDVPTGWNMFINGTQVYTASEIRNAGIANWCGINNDCDGSGKDGNMGFGIWTSGIPTFELSQSISGLENGTYIIRAGLMAGANGNGSRMTTQRIFGNLNSTYYGEEAIYDPLVLDANEVYAFASNPEVVTDRELYPVEVRAYVYDGTLTFGVRTDGNIAATYRTSGNSAGGDGWFKVDNFTIHKEGYNGEDAAAVANHFISVINNYLSTKVFEKSIEEEVSSYVSSEIDATTPASDINAAIITLKEKIPLIEASATAYSKLLDAINRGLDNLEDYSYTPSAETVLAPAIEEGQIGYDERNVDAAQIDVVIAAIDAAIAKVKSEAVQEGEYANVIVNGSFEDLTAQNNNNSSGVENPPVGWTLVMNGIECTSRSDYGKAGANLGWCAINGGDGISSTDENGTYWDHQYTDGEHLWGIWGGNIPEIELSQTIKGLPAGTYTLSCDMVVQYNWGGQCLTTQRIFANKYVQMFGAEDTYASFTEWTEDMLLASSCDTEYPDAEYKHMSYAGHYQPSSEGGVSDCPRPMSLTFGLQEGEDLKFGFRTNNVDVVQNTPHPYDSAGWFKLDNFKLLYESSSVPEGTDATSVDAINSEKLQVTGIEYYTLSGISTSEPQRGINIVKMHLSDGSVKTSKVLIK